MNTDGSPMSETRSAGAVICEEHRRLLDEFGEAVEELLLLHEHQFLAIVQGDTVDLSRFLRQPVKTQFSLNGELCHGIDSTNVHA